MKIACIIPGPGGSFYCENCIRDLEHVRAMRSMGHEVVIVPMYLPITIEAGELGAVTPIQFGAVNLYLKQVLPLFRKSPRWLERLLDSVPLLNMAAKKAGSTRASGLEQMTLSMLRGEDGGQAAQLDQLAAMLGDTVRPEVIHLSNGLLLGLAGRLKDATGAAVVCSLQDEDTWINAMEEGVARAVWQTMTKKGRAVDAFITVSSYYAGVVKAAMRLSDERLHIIPPGIDPRLYASGGPSFDPPVIGFLSRMSESLGLGALIDAFVALKRDSSLSRLKLRVSGGQTGDDRAFIARQKKRLKGLGMLEDVEFVPGFERADRIAFMQPLSVLSVPARQGQAFGLYLLEAMALGVPVVQPDSGGFPELVESTGGGVVYPAGDGELLRQALYELLTDRERGRRLGRTGSEGVRRRYNIERMAQDMIQVYEECRT